MTNPGFMGQRAAQQASMSASRSAQQQAAANYQRTSQHASSLHYRNHRPSDRSGGFGLLGTVFRVVFTLLTLAAAIGIALAILNMAQPEWFAHVKAWFTHTF